MPYSTQNRNRRHEASNRLAFRTLITAASLSFVMVPSPARAADELDLDDASSLAIESPKAAAPKVTSPQAEKPSKSAKPKDELSLDDDLEKQLDAGEPLKPSESSPAEVQPKERASAAPVETAAPAAPVVVDAPPAPVSPEPVAPAPAAPAVVPEPTAPIVETAPVAPAPTAPSGPAVAERTNKNGKLFDAPDVQKEKRLSRIMQSYKPIDSQRWSDLISKRHEENYNIQKGDTLWDLSKTFFGDGFFWGKLWSQNSVIENPHEISKGHAIRFVAGTEADAPSVQIADASANDTISIRSVSAKSASNEGVIVQPVYREEAEREISKEELESGNVVELDELVAAPEIPPPSRPLGPLRDLPPSFKEKVNDDENKAYNKAGVSFSGSAVSDALRRPAKVVVNSLILDRQPSNLGKVDEIELGEVFAGIGQIVYLRANSRMAPGDRFQIWTSRGKLGKGYVFDICGVVQVTGYVDLDQNIFRAVVVSTNAPIAKGGLIIADKPKIVDFSLSTQRSEVSAEVIGGEFANKRELFGEGAIVFLNGGSLDGFKEGDLVGVQAVRKSRREKSNYPKSQYPVAIVKVVDVHERVATGLVVKASEAIATGDRTGSELPRDALKLHVENPEDLSHDVFGSSR